MEFISHIIEFIRDFWDNLIPFEVLSEFDSGVVLRLGKYKKRVEAGFHWKIPFIDKILTCRNSITTLPVKPQTLTTVDEKNVVVSSVVKYKIVNAKIFLLEVEDAVDAINDIAQGLTRELVSNQSWDSLKNMKDEEIKIRLESEAKRWGIKVYNITLTDLAQIRTIRLIN